MYNLVFKWLLVSCFFFFSFFVHSATGIIFKDINKIQDSTKIDFNKKIADVKNDSIKLIDVYFEYGKYLDESGSSEKSIKQFKKALQIAQSTDNNVKLATVANYLGNKYAAISDFKLSNETYLLALKAAEKTTNSDEIAKISMNLASNYNFIGNYEKATKYGLYSLKIKETKNNIERICYHYIAMGNIFRENNNIVKWEEYVQKAYKMKDVKGCASFSDIAKIYNSLGGLAVQKEEFEKALAFYDTLMVMSKEANFTQGISTSLTNSAGIHKQQGNFFKALELSKEAEKYFGENPYESIFNKNFKAEIYNLTGQFKKGLSLVGENIKEKGISFYSTEKLKCLELLYQLNFNLNNYEEAFFWNDSLRSTENFLRDEDIRQSIEDLEAKYETEKKEQRIELLTTENKVRNQQMWLFVAVTIILFLFILFGIFVSVKKRKENSQRQKILKQQLLRSQMSPHFLFNALSSIQNFMLNNETKKASGYLSNFASLTRNILEQSDKEFVTVSEEIETLRSYIELEKMRMKNNFDFEFIYSKTLETDFINIPPMLVQPFVENAIKHGLNNIDYKGLLELKFEEKEFVLHIEIEDNGVGINNRKNNKKKTHRSMSMNIFEQRRIVLEKRTKRAIGIEIIDLKNMDKRQTGTLVKIEIPIVV